MNHTPARHHSTKSKVLFILSILLLVYWWIAKYYNIQSSTILSVVYDIFWLPMLLFFVVIPALTLYYLWREGFHYKSLYAWSLILVAITAGLFLL